jgi:hypothetical protein
MTTNATPDDLDALRTILDTLEPFDEADRQRIIRWAMEKMGLKMSNSTQSATMNVQPGTASQVIPAVNNHDIKSFVAAKSPQGDNQLSAVVAYYYKFEAPANQRKDSITTEDILNVCRLAGLSRPKRPAQTLVNAHTAGLLDKGADRGTYQINSVGENLVAVSLPSNLSSPVKRRKKVAKKVTAKKSKK